ncbi:MAG: hypothetical protein IT384_15880 [Deltaproteobacteria bacterium]|nr:hypothetical protein [Deltaproteobacteria bacterium]
MMSFATTLIFMTAALELTQVQVERAPVEQSAHAEAERAQTAGDWLMGSGTGLFAISYGLTVGVSLSSDPDCQGSVCNERYLSLLPVVGPLLQIAVAGPAFHDEHHTDACIPRIAMAVSGQAIGVAAFVVGAILRSQGDDDPDSLVQRLTIGTDTYDGRGFGINVGLTRF